MPQYINEKQLGCIVMLTRGFLLATLLTLSFALSVNADLLTGQGTFDPPAIPEGGSIFSTISIADAGILDDISITIQGLSHTNAGDVSAELRFTGDGGPDDGNPAYVFFRPNFDGVGVGSEANLGGNYTFTTNPQDNDFWAESSLPDDEQVPNQDYFFSDENGDFHDLSSEEFFGGVNPTGEWQLVITDNNAFGNNLGSVQGWELNITTIPEPASAAIIVSLASAAMIRRRRS